MKKLLLILLPLFLSVCAMAQIDKYVPKVPNPPRLVNDYTNTLTPAQVDELERKLVALDDSTSNQVAVVIIPTTGDYDIQEVALQIIRTWGVGNKKTNNGVVLLVAKDDHHLRIETGYGLEGAIPDITAKSIIDNEITPRFKEGNYYRGINDGVDAIIRAAAGEYKAPEGYHASKKGPNFGTIIFIIIMIIIFLIRGGGGGGGTYASRRGLGALPWIIGGLSGGGGGGGGWSGGGGGGFGGFGGGGGGGGGASGSW